MGEELEQELSMIHIGLGNWLLGIDLIHNDEVIKNPLGLVFVTGEENLYFIKSAEEEEEVEVDDIEKTAQVMNEVSKIAEDLGVPTDKLTEAVIKLGQVLRENGMDSWNEEAK